MSWFYSLWSFSNTPDTTKTSNGESPFASTEHINSVETSETCESSKISQSFKSHPVPESHLFKLREVGSNKSLYLKPVLKSAKPQIPIPHEIFVQQLGKCTVLQDYIKKQHVSS